MQINPYKWHKMLVVCRPAMVEHMHQRPTWNHGAMVSFGLNVAFCEGCSQLCFLAQEFCFSVSSRGVVGDFCVYFSCVSLDQSTSSSLLWCMCQFRCGWDRPAHIEIRKWKNLNEYCTSMIYVYIYVCIYVFTYKYIYILCVYFMMKLYIYILCVWKWIWSWAVLSFLWCFLDDLFTLVSLCTPRFLQLVLCFIHHSQQLQVSKVVPCYTPCSSLKRSRGFVNCTLENMAIIAS